MYCAVWCRAQTQARRLRPNSDPQTVFVAEMTEAWSVEFHKGVKKFKDGDYESALASFTAVSVHALHEMRWQFRRCIYEGDPSRSERTQCI